MKKFFFSKVTDFRPQPYQKTNSFFKDFAKILVTLCDIGKTSIIRKTLQWLHLH